ncbi:MAG: DoxX family protein [Nonomuraea sp.]|nr:DoxX family protein [Nonomuraea sp.]
MTSKHYYWLATAPVVAELGAGGVMDVAGFPAFSDLVRHLGYPGYFLTFLGVCKVLGAFALVVPGRPLLKEWAYAGAFFTYVAAVVSHVATGYQLYEVAVLGVLAVLTVLSWRLRPPGRRQIGGVPAQEGRRTAG